MRLAHKATAAKMGNKRTDIVPPLVTRALFFMDFVVYPPLIALFFYLAFYGTGIARRLEMLGLFLFGVLLWSLLEYLAHRYVLHVVPYFERLHNEHHEEPRRLVGTPTIVSVLAFFCLAYLPTAKFSDARSAAAIVCGLMLGYLAYVSCHFVIHHLASGGSRLVKRLKRHHSLHHHASPECNFGVTTRVWDRLFGTLAS